MNTAMIIIALAAGLALGAVIGILTSKSQKSASDQKAKMLGNENDQLKVELKEKDQKIAGLTEEKMQLATEKTTVATRLEASESHRTADTERMQKEIEEMKAESQRQMSEAKAEWEKREKEAIAAQQARFEETMAKVSEQMKTATDQMLKDRQKEFETSSNTNLGQIVNPLKETIENMKKAMNDTRDKQTAMSSEMKANLENMLKHSDAAKESADELARVFKHQSKVQGDWGERVLDELLGMHGLTRGVHYDIQEVIRDGNGNVIKTDDGRIMRPDVILHLDKKREVIIDSKVSLTAYMDYVNAETEEDRSRCLKAHIDSLHKHVKELSEKDYSSYIKPPKAKMDYVIMFVPHTGALLTAMNEQPDLWRKAMDKGVYIADEQTLFAALKIINLTWTQIAQAQNHERVYELANEMLDRVGQFWKKYELIGGALEKATKAYEEGEKKLMPNGQSILQTCGKLEKLGAKQSDRNPLPEFEDVDDIEKIEGVKESVEEA